MFAESKPYGIASKILQGTILTFDLTKSPSMAKFTEAISALYERLDELIEQERTIKRTINDLSVIDGVEAPFPDVETAGISGIRNIRSDQFFGKSLNGAVKEYLRIIGRAVPVKEILEGLKRGGFEFPSHWAKEHWLKNLSISISKNRNDFVYVKSSDSWGLWDFYPEKKREREAMKSTGKQFEGEGDGFVVADQDSVNPEQPVKRRRGRPSKAEVEARKLAEQQKQIEESPVEAPQEIPQ
jgi:hypothetical protein